jgi:hypothetical protein
LVVVVVAEVVQVVEVERAVFKQVCPILFHQESTILQLVEVELVEFSQGVIKGLLRQMEVHRPLDQLLEMEVAGQLVSAHLHHQEQWVQVVAVVMFLVVQQQEQVGQQVKETLVEVFL